MSAHPFQIKAKEDNTQLHDMQLLQQQIDIMSANYELALKQEEDRKRAKKTLGILLLTLVGSYFITMSTLSILDYMGKL